MAMLLLSLQNLLRLFAFCFFVCCFSFLFVCILYFVFVLFACLFVCLLFVVCSLFVCLLLFCFALSSSKSEAVPAPVILFFVLLLYSQPLETCTFWQPPMSRKVRFWECGNHRQPYVGLPHGTDIGGTSLCAMP